MKLVDVTPINYLTEEELKKNSLRRTVRIASLFVVMGICIFFFIMMQGSENSFMRVAPLIAAIAAVYIAYKEIVLYVAVTDSELICRGLDLKISRVKISDITGAESNDFGELQIKSGDETILKVRADSNGYANLIRYFEKRVEKR